MILEINFWIISKYMNLVSSNFIIEEEFRNSIVKLFDELLGKWIYWISSIIFLILLIFTGIKIANAKSESEKINLNKKLIHILIVFIVIIFATTLVNVVKVMIENIWSTTSNISLFFGK